MFLNTTSADDFSKTVFKALVKNQGSFDFVELGQFGDTASKASENKKDELG